MNLKSTFQKYTQLTSELKDVTSELAQSLQGRFEDYQAEVSALRQELFYPPSMSTIECEGGSGLWYLVGDGEDITFRQRPGSEYLTVETTVQEYDGEESVQKAYVPMWLLEDCWDEVLEAKVTETRKVFTDRTAETLRAEDARYHEYLRLAAEFKHRV